LDQQACRRIKIEKKNSAALDGEARVFIKEFECGENGVAKTGRKNDNEHDSVINVEDNSLNEFKEDTLEDTAFVGDLLHEARTSDQEYMGPEVGALNRTLESSGMDPEIFHDDCKNNSQDDYATAFVTNLLNEVCTLSWRSVKSELNPDIFFGPEHNSPKQKGDKNNSARSSSKCIDLCESESCSLNSNATTFVGNLLEEACTLNQVLAIPEEIYPEEAFEYNPKEKSGESNKIERISTEIGHQVDSKNSSMIKDAAGPIEAAALYARTFVNKLLREMCTFDREHIITSDSLSITAAASVPPVKALQEEAVADIASISPVKALKEEVVADTMPALNIISALVPTPAPVVATTPCNASFIEEEFFFAKEDGASGDMLAPQLPASTRTPRVQNGDSVVTKCAAAFVGAVMDAAATSISTQSSNRSIVAFTSPASNAPIIAENMVPINMVSNLELEAASSCDITRYAAAFVKTVICELKVPTATVVQTKSNGSTVKFVPPPEPSASSIINSKRAASSSGSVDDNDSTFLLESAVEIITFLAHNMSAEITATAMKKINDTLRPTAKVCEEEACRLSVADSSPTTPSLSPSLKHKLLSKDLDEVMTPAVTTNATNHENVSSVNRTAIPTVHNGTSDGDHGDDDILENQKRSRAAIRIQAINRRKSGMRYRPKILFNLL
jgi:hypothetical protein